MTLRRGLITLLLASLAGTSLAQSPKDVTDGELGLSLRAVLKCSLAAAGFLRSSSTSPSAL